MDDNIMLWIVGAVFILLFIWLVMTLHAAKVPAGTATPEKRDSPKPLPPDASGTNVHALRATSAPSRAKRAPAKKAPAPAPAKKAPAAKPKRATPAKAKKARAAKPKAAPRAARSKDELQRINGIGPKIDGQLKAMKITTYAQIAAFKKADIERVNEKLKFKGRIEREQWVPQAKLLAAGKEAAFEKKFGKGAKAS